MGAAGKAGGTCRTEWDPNTGDACQGRRRVGPYPAGGIQLRPCVIWSGGMMSCTNSGWSSLPDWQRMEVCCNPANRQGRFGKNRDPDL